MNRNLRVASVVVCIAFAWSLSHAQAPLAVYPNPIQFGTVALNSPSYPILIYVSNTTSTAEDITAVSISGTNSTDFALITAACVGTIPPASYCEMQMTFTPSAMGARSASLLITVSGVINPISVSLTGTGGNPIANVTSVSPANIYVGSSATTITITGTGFVNSSVAYLGNSNLPLTTTFVSATQLKAQVPTADLSQPTQYQLFVSNPPPAGGSSGGAALQVINPEPSINSVSPASVVAGINPGPIALNGANFMTGAKVQWNGVNVSTTYVSSSELTILPTVAQLGGAGIVELSVTNPSPGTISAPMLFEVTSPTTITILDLPANDLVWDPFAQVIYASVPSSDGVNGNSIAVINPATGAITGYHFAGSEPTKIGLSPTSNFLYVGLNGSGSIQRLDLPAFTKDIDISLGSTNGNINVADDVKVSPSNPHTIAVAIGFANGCCGSGPLEFFTDSTKLANSVSSEPVNQIIFPTGTTLFGYDNGTVSQIAVSSTGGTLTTSWYGIVNGSTVQYAAGLIYSSAGQAFNPATGLLVGTYDIGSVCCNSVQVLPNSALNRVFAVGDTPFFSSFGITSYNLAQFTPVGVASLEELVPSFNSTSATNLIQWGASGLAFTLQPGCCGSTSTQVVLVTSPTLLLTAARTAGPTPVLKSLSPTTATHGSGNFVLTIRGSNFVPGSTVTWKGKSVFANYLSPSALRVYVPNADIAAAGAVSVVVKNPAPGGGKSNILSFVVK